MHIIGSSVSEYSSDHKSIKLWLSDHQSNAQVLKATRRAAGRFALSQQETAGKVEQGAADSG